MKLSAFRKLAIEDKNLPKYLKYTLEATAHIPLEKTLFLLNKILKLNSLSFQLFIYIVFSRKFDEAFKLVFVKNKKTTIKFINDF